MKAVTFAAGLAAGYILGTRAGREKYEQIVESARTLSNKPAVQQAQTKARVLVGQGTQAVGAKLHLNGDGDASLSSADTVDSAATTRKVNGSSPKKSTSSAADTAF